MPKDAINVSIPCTDIVLLSLLGESLQGEPEPPPLTPRALFSETGRESAYPRLVQDGTLQSDGGPVPPEPAGPDIEPEF